MTTTSSKKRACLKRHWTRSSHTACSKTHYCVRHLLRYMVIIGANRHRSSTRTACAVRQSYQEPHSRRATGGPSSRAAGRHDRSNPGTSSTSSCEWNCGTAAIAFSGCQRPLRRGGSGRPPRPHGAKEQNYVDGSPTIWMIYVLVPISEHHSWHVFGVRLFRRV